MPSLCIVSITSEYDEGGDLSAIYPVDANNFDLVLGSSNATFYPEYTTFINIEQSKVKTYHRINVHFTTAPSVPLEVT